MKKADVLHVELNKLQFIVTIQQFQLPVRLYAYFYVPEETPDVGTLNVLLLSSFPSA